MLVLGPSDVSKTRLGSRLVEIITQLMSLSILGPECSTQTQSRPLRHYLKLPEARTVRLGEDAMWVHFWPEASKTHELLFLPVTIEDMLAQALSLVYRLPDSGS
jgi:hypothetical protein